MLIHAYRRKGATQVDTGNTHIDFQPNEKGDVVAEVELAEDCDQLLAIREAFCAYEVAGAKPEANPLFVVTNGNETLDLNALDDVALRAFAKSNGVALHHKNTGNAIRQKIVDALKAE